MSSVRFFNTISQADVREVGGKGASLGEMTQAGMPVPPGFVIGAEIYRKYAASGIPADVEEEILEAFDILGADRVAVRSSALAEDSKTSSWAGQLETYLSVNRGALIENIKNCWDSIRSERALAYAVAQNVSQDQLVVAVVVQKMVESESSGVLFTVHPITHDTGLVMIEAILGLGEMLVQGMVIPDNFVVHKDPIEIKSQDIHTKETMLVFQEGENKEIPVPDDEKNQPALTEEQVEELVALALKIENHYQLPQDIEWAFAEGKFYILQSRPITAL